MDTILGATIKTNKQNNGRTPDKGNSDRRDIQK